MISKHLILSLDFNLRDYNSFICEDRGEVSVCAEIFGNDDYLFCGWELIYGLWKSKLLKHSNGSNQEEGE